MKSQKYFAAVIGTGRIGFSLGFDKKREQPASHTMALLLNKKINLIAAADKNAENLAEWKKYVRSKKCGKTNLTLTFDSSEKLYENITCLDIIVVAVNEENHLEECLKAIAYKPRLVILEKPVALNTEQAQKIKEAAHANGVPVLVNHERRFALDYLKAKELMGKIGEIQKITGWLYSGLRVYGKEFEKDGTYSLLHDGTHLVDIVNFLSEQELHSPLVTGIFRDEKNIVRNFTASYKETKIPEITLTMSGRSKFFEFGVEILGTTGKICLGNGFFKFYRRKESKLYTGFYSLKSEKVKLPKKTLYFANMIQNAVDFLDGKAELRSPLSIAIEDLRALEEIKKALID